MEFNKILIGLRKEKKLLQTDVAKKIGVARATYGAYEQGTRQPDFETLQIIADFFNVSTDNLLGRTDLAEPTNTDTTTNQDNILTEDEEFEAFANDPELERWYKDLPKSDEEDLQSLKQMWEIIKKNKK